MLLSVYDKDIITILSLKDDVDLFLKTLMIIPSPLNLLLFVQKGNRDYWKYQKQGDSSLSSDDHNVKDYDILMLMIITFVERSTDDIDIKIV